VDHIIVAIPKDVLESLAESSYDYVDDANGPGRVFCNHCLASVDMHWNQGKQLEDGSNIEHHPACAQQWAVKILNNL